jgi:hypothetical protein
VLSQVRWHLAGGSGQVRQLLRGAASAPRSTRRAALHRAVQPCRGAAGGRCSCPGLGIMRRRRGGWCGLFMAGSMYKIWCTLLLQLCLPSSPRLETKLLASGRVCCQCFRRLCSRPLSVASGITCCLWSVTQLLCNRYFSTPFP